MASAPQRESVRSVLPELEALERATGQSTSSAHERDYDTFEMILPDGTRKKICFDITSFYGKP